MHFFNLWIGKLYDNMNKQRTAESRRRKLDSSSPKKVLASEAIALTTFQLACRGKL